MAAVPLSLLLLLTLFFHSHFPATGASKLDTGPLQIIIGAESPSSPDYGDCPPPPPPPKPICPPPPPPPEPICPPPLHPPPSPSPPLPPPTPSPSPPPHPPPSPSPPPPPKTPSPSPPPHPPPSPSPPPPPTTPSPSPPPHPPPSPSPPPPPTTPSPSPPPHPPPSPCPPPPPTTPSPSPPQGFENTRIKKAFKVIQRFRTKIKCDPQRITDSWRGNSVCDYIGFRCAIRPDINMRAVAAADFNGYGFGSSDCRHKKNDLQLVGFLNELEDLTLFHANSNNFTGEIPPNLGAKIKYFYEIDLSNNKFDGDFPKQILDATNASFIDLRYNSFSGKVPGQIFQRDLDVLFLNNNGFTGPIPGNLGDVPALYLTFANNRFSGEIPKSIGRCRNLLEVLFLNNQLSGCLPAEIGNLTKARVFDAGDNKLTGPIPHSFACLSSMKELNFARNELYGAIPEGVCQLPKLENLSLSYNYFTQVGPKCRDLIRKKILDVRHNCILDLPGQRSAAECAKFFSSKYVCSDEKMLMSYVPCKKGSGVGENVDLELAPAPAPSSITYRALSPHMLRR